jgi:DnaJ like chaperone protein
LPQQGKFRVTSEQPQPDQVHAAFLAAATQLGMAAGADRPGPASMGIFSDIAALLSDGAGRIGSAASSIRAALATLANCEVHRQATFAIAMIALSAKMAKADGVVMPSEVDAFCRSFTIPQGEEVNVSRIYNLAKRDTAGFEAYARNVARLLADNRDMLEDILDGLFDIAKADGAVHERELTYLHRVAELFGFDEHAFARIRARHVLGGRDDPYLVLGADPSWDHGRLRRHYLKLVTENHPDRLIARGIPEEFVRIATDRLAAINNAWESIEGKRARA